MLLCVVQMFIYKLNNTRGQILRLLYPHGYVLLCASTHTNAYPTLTHFLAVVENYRAPMHACMVMGAMERGNGLFVVSC